MSKIDDAADQVLGLADRFRGILEVADVIKSIGSLDQAVTERQAALEAVTEQHEAAKAELATTGTELYALRATQADELAQHKKDCDALSVTATEEAANIRSQARTIADTLVESTQLDMASRIRATDAVIAEKQSELSDLQSKIDDATKALADITATHEATSQRVDALRAAAKSVLGD